MTDRGIVELDGSFGEGGGQILRSALALAILAQRPFRITRIRAGRDRPGLQPQHLASVRAAARICNGAAIGAAKGSQELEFTPGPAQGGFHNVDIGTAGSVTLLLHAVVYPLAVAAQPSALALTGGTHVTHSPGFHDLQVGWAPWLERMGVRVQLDFRRGGFYPAGGGQMKADLPGGAAFVPIVALERGSLTRVRVLSGIGNLPLSIAERQAGRAVERLRRAGPLLQGARVEDEIVPVTSISPGTFVTLVAEFSSGPVTFTALGERSKRAEQVADEACDAFFAFLDTRGVVDRHLADQLVMPMALAPGESSVRVERVTRHLTTNLEVVRRFLETRWTLDAAEGEEGVLTIAGQKM